MSVKIVSGVPGSGKTLYATYLAKQHFKKENSKLVKVFRQFKRYLYNSKLFLLNTIRKCLKIDLLPYREDIYKKYIYDKNNKVNNIYSNYPIFLYKYYDKDSKKYIKVYSNSISLWDLNNSFKTLPYSLIIIDEVQLYIDSDEYQDKVSRENFRPIAKYLQAHRHFGVKDILFISQHPNRVMAKIRNVSNEFIQIKRFIKLPFVSIGLCFGTKYYECDSYGKSTKVDKKFVPYDWKKIFIITNIKKIYKSYDTTYLRILNLDKPLKIGTYSNKYLSKQEYLTVFRNR